MTTVLGIDPGLTGAVAVIDPNGLRTVFDIPTMDRPNIGPKARVKRQCDGRALAELLRSHHDPRDAALIVLEDVRMMGGVNNAMQAQEALVHTRGVIEGVLAAKGYVVTVVSPQEWKRFYGLKADKTQCLDLARKLYGVDHLKRQKDHNRAESMLIARWAQKNLI